MKRKLVETGTESALVAFSQPIPAELAAEGARHGLRQQVESVYCGSASNTGLGLDSTRNLLRLDRPAVAGLATEAGELS